MKGIFIAATGQNVGKTTACLGIMSGLKKRFSSVGFTKPVGQVHVKLEDGLLVDKDALLFKDCFNLTSSYQDMSPVVLPSGFTKEYLDGKVSDIDLKKNITKAFDNIASQNDFVIVEGTGHTGVGSIVNLSNAEVAKLLGLDMVIVANAGLGSCFDEIALNRAMCNAAGVSIRGIILNKVIEEKRNMILEYMPKALQRWSIPLLGCIPFNTLLSLPCMRDFENLFETTLLSGEEHRYRHFQHTRLVDTSLKLYREIPSTASQLIIIPATREDVILATLAKYWNEKLEIGFILTGRLAPRPGLIEKIQRTGIPSLWTPLSSFRSMQKISSFTAKIRLEDASKVQQAINLVEPNINFDALLPACD